MAVLKKLVEPVIESATDFLKSFSDKTFYHGTYASPKIEKFNPRIHRTGDRTPATFFTTSKGYAEGFAEETGNPKIYEVKLKTKDIFDYRNPDDLKKLKNSLGDTLKNLTPRDYRNPDIALMTGDPFFYQDKNISEKLMELGYRGYHTNEVSQLGEETIGLFYPDEGDVRSISAKFDPKESESGNIMAAVPVATSIGALSVLPEETRR
jgi:hypothetical protein